MKLVLYREDRILARQEPNAGAGSGRWARRRYTLPKVTQHAKWVLGAKRAQAQAQGANHPAYLYYTHQVQP